MCLDQILKVQLCNYFFFEAEFQTFFNRFYCQLFAFNILELFL
ncbi:hypothetical protein PLA106_07185 [Pseudomonas amygdali pv. lachrymans str. M302278]|nr:hypothetical protein PLA106_07185 [Pseudomonas amygdali pv. lachrymans str. M302278]